MLSGWDDTIVALATPPGVGAIGIIRLSGAKAIAIAAALFYGRYTARWLFVVKIIKKPPA